MDLRLERGDLLQLDTISNCGTLKLFPPGKKQKQKLVVGDDSGMVSCYEFKKGEPQVVFNEKAFDGPISCLAIGGPISKRDKFFVAQGQRVVGINKKGKEFFKLTSSLTEAIRSIAVEDTKIWSACELIYSLYDNGQDSAFYMSNDVINGLIVENVVRTSDYDVVLACQDRCIRVISDSRSTLEIPVSAPVTCVTTVTWQRSNGVHANPESAADVGDSKMKRDATGLVYGLDSGGIGYCQVDRGGALSSSWYVDDDGADEASAVTCIALADLTKDGAIEILIGRNDGRVEVYAQRNGAIRGIASLPVRVFSASIGETVRSICCGRVNSAEYNEVIVAGYSGKIISFTTEPVLQREQGDAYGRSLQTVNNENRIKHLRAEVKALQQKVTKEQEKVKGTFSGQGGAKSLSDKVGSIGAQEFPINSSFALDSQNALYRLSLEIQSPLDMVILRSPVMLELKDSDLGATVVSVIPKEYLSEPSNMGSNAEAEAKFVAAYRCQNGEKRITISLRPTEGFYGDLTVIVVACCSPKAAKVLKFPLKPLSLHSKVHDLTSVQETAPRSKVSFRGSISIDMVHEWVQFLFPEVPPRLQEDVAEARFNFVNSFTGSVTTCMIQRNELVIGSQNISTVSIAKETIARLATQRRMPLDEQVTIEEESVTCLISQIWPMLSYQLALSKKMELIESLREVAMQEKDSDSWLSKEYKEILSNRDSIAHEYKSSEQSLNYLFGVVQDLYVDWQKTLGFDAVHKVPELIQIIRGNNSTNLVDFFMRKKK